jgi:hypothetical protein
VVRVRRRPEAEVEITEDGTEEPIAQHQLLSVHIDKSVLEFLIEVGAAIDFDEYG